MKKSIKIILIGIISFIAIHADTYLSCKDAYYKLNKHNKRASLFINNSDWEMANFYVEKIKDDYRYFYGNDCFEKTFNKQNVDRMKKIYAKNIKIIKNLSEMINETIVEKERQEKARVLRELEEKKKMDRKLLKAEIRAEMEAEKNGKDYPLVNGENGDIINDKESFMKAYLKSKKGNVKIFNAIKE